ncbi:uncharacterized protein LOC108023305 [Drosophila biarmipes]|uniref:uncharacterized protein LOC108023305 n=1 Tax=Drosophila biarmipes TaxID=125945 RepID=UPI0007E6C5BF|nr:uncharacterized protein LOC108023305 [Drosophila biarmipes]
MSLFRWRDPGLLHTLNFVRGIRTGAHKVASNPRQRNRVRRQANDSRFSPSRLRHGKLFRAEASQSPDQKLTSYGEYMEMMASRHEKQLKLEEDMARAESARQKAREQREREKAEQSNEAPLILCAEDVTGLRKMYLLDGEELQNEVLRMHDSDRSFMDEPLDEPEAVVRSLRRLQVFEDSIPWTSSSGCDEIVDLPELRDGEEQWNPDSSHGNWVRRVMQFLRFRRLS